MYRYKNTNIFFYKNVSLLKLAVKIQSGEIPLLEISRVVSNTTDFCRGDRRPEKLNREDETMPINKGMYLRTLFIWSSRTVN